SATIRQCSSLQRSPHTQLTLSSTANRPVRRPDQPRQSWEPGSRQHCLTLSSSSPPTRSTSRGRWPVVTASSAAGDLAQWGSADVKLRVPLDTALAITVRDAIRAARISVVGVSYGGNNQAEAVMPMDWATLIPLWWMGGRSDPQVPAVIVSPARDLS